MDSPQLSVVIPTFDDFDGALFTLQSMRMGNDLSEVELVLVDTKPDSPGSADLKRIIETQMIRKTAGARYVPVTDLVGPAAAKNRAFAEARGKIVWCLDSHVLVYPGTVQKLLDFYQRNPDCMDLLSGPLVYDNLTNISTHFADVWRGEMWGIWANAWVDTDGRTFSVYDDGGKAKYLPLKIDAEPLTTGLPFIPYANHEPTLTAAGCRPLGYVDSDDFEIPGTGCGQLICRKDAWPGFNDNFYGFGAEEMYIHEKFRQAGHAARCLGFLKWWHRFPRPAGIKYMLLRWHKVRNFVLGHMELNRPLEPVRAHFESIGFTAEEWDQLMKDPVGQIMPPNMPKQSARAASAPQSLEGIYEESRSTSAYFSEHMPTIRGLASQCKSVCDITRNRETSLAVLAAKPNVVNSYLFEAAARDTSTYGDLHRAIQSERDPMTYNSTLIDDPTAIEIADCEMLVYKVPHSHKGLDKDLARYSPKVSRWIVLHDTQRNGEVLDEGGIGYKHRINQFLKENSDWFIYRHYDNQTGLTVLGRDPRDKPVPAFEFFPPEVGPGAELSKILKTLEINPKAGCGCKNKSKQMDLWGVAGCARNFDVIVHWMQEGQSKWGWKDKLKAAAMAVKTGLAFEISWIDPWPDLIEQAIRNAAKAEGIEMPEIQHHGLNLVGPDGDMRVLPSYQEMKDREKQKAVFLAQEAFKEKQEQLRLERQRELDELLKNRGAVSDVEAPSSSGE